MTVVRPEIHVRKGGEKRLAAEAFSGLVSDILSRGKKVRFKAAGGSMSPFVKDGDIVSISPLKSGKPRLGDVVGFINPASSGLALHRLVGETSRGYLIRGDNSLEPDGEIDGRRILGRMTSIERDGRKMKMERYPQRLLIALLSRAGFLRGVVSGLRKVFRRAGAK